jgi:osmotically-inducible protein OsmY
MTQNVSLRTLRPSVAARCGRPLLAVALAAAAVSQLSGCVALVGGAAVGGAMVATDRRTSGTQVEDESIELKGGTRAGEVLGDKGHINITSYNRIVLITGEVPEDTDKEAVGKSIAGIDNVASVQNELEVGFTSSFTSRSNDTYITSKVKTSLIDAKDLQSNAIKVVTERGNVYLMGIVTQREADRAAEVARGVSGVKKVVRVFQVVADNDLAHIQTH